MKSIPSCIARLDQRFLDQERELSFKKSLEGELIVGLRLVCTLVMLVMVYHIAVFPIGAYVQIRTIYIRMKMSILCVAVVCIICFSARLHLGKFKVWNWEAISVGVSVYISIAGILGNAWTAARLCGMDPLEVWGGEMAQSAEGAVILAIDCITTAICVYLPIRACVLWIQPVCSLVVFTICAIYLGSPFPQFLPNNVLLLFILLLLAVSGSWNKEYSTREKWLAQRLVVDQQSELERQYLGISCILSQLCDCLIHLGPSFRIVDPCPRLAELLLWTDNKKLDSFSFCDYIASEQDRDSFIDALEGCKRKNDSDDDAGTLKESSEGMLHISLRDASGRIFSVRAHHSRFHDSGGQPRYLVGLIEDAERPTISCDVSEVDALPSMSSNFMEHSSSRSAKTNKFCIWVDSTTPRFTVRKYEAGCERILGKLGKHCHLSHYLDDQHQFHRWLQLQTNNYLEGLGGEAGKDKLRVRLIPPEKVHKPPFLAVCKVLQEKESGSLSFEEEAPAEVDLENLCLEFKVNPQCSSRGTPSIASGNGSAGMLGGERSLSL